jgi:hypothetical protein
MIISHKYKFIFIKTGKVAGSSLELALRPHLGVDDIVTPIAEDTRRGVSSNDFVPTDHGLGAGPKNFINNIDYKRRISEAGARGVFYEHAWAYEIKGQVSSEIWDNYYKFTIERDPRDKSLSVYYHNRNGLSWPIRQHLINSCRLCIPFTNNKLRSYSSIAKICSVSRWLKEDKRHTFAMNWNRYTVNDEVIVDKVYSYNLMNELITDLQDIIGSKLDLPNLKSTFRTKRDLTIKENKLLEQLMENKIYQKEYDILNNRK